MFAQRINEKIDRFGEQFTIGGNTYKGIFRPLDTGMMRMYLDDTEVMGVERPGLALVTVGSAILTIGGTITRDGRTYEILKVFPHRISQTVVAKTAILA